PARTSMPSDTLVVIEARTPGAAATVIDLVTVNGPKPPELIASTSPPGLVTDSARVKLRHSLPAMHVFASLPNVATKLRLFWATREIGNRNAIASPILTARMTTSLI